MRTLGNNLPSRGVHGILSRDAGIDEAVVQDEWTRTQAAGYPTMKARDKAPSADFGICNSLCPNKPSEMVNGQLFGDISFDKHLQHGS